VGIVTRGAYSSITATKEAASTQENIMSDNILSAVLTFSLLAGGTAAIGSEMFDTPQPAKAPVIVMPQVTITAQRAATPEVVTLPEVTITGLREAAPVAVTLPEATITAKREAAAPAEVVTMPMVVVTGRREALTVAAESHDDVGSPRIQ
jgi:hypothetical protein